MAGTSDDVRGAAERVAGTSDDLRGASERVAGTSDDVRGASERVAGTAANLDRVSEWVAGEAADVGGAAELVTGAAVEQAPDMARNLIVGAVDRPERTVDQALTLGQTVAPFAAAAPGPVGVERVAAPSPGEPAASGDTTPAPTTDLERRSATIAPVATGGLGVRPISRRTAGSVVGAPSGLTWVGPVAEETAESIGALCTE